MLKAKDIMVTEIITVDPKLILTDAIRTLIDNKISGAPVVNSKGNMVGMISERDILNFIFSGNINNTTVEEAMSKEITSFPPDADVDGIALVMGEKKIRRVPIVDKGKVVGIISRRNIIKIALLNE